MKKAAQCARSCARSGWERNNGHIGDWRCGRLGNQHSQAASVQQGAECGLAGIPTGDENLNQAKDRVIEVMLCMADSRRRDML